jgi:hypothetical protein
MSPWGQSHIQLRITDLNNVVLETPEATGKLVFCSNEFLAATGKLVFCSNEFLHTSCLKVFKNDQQSASPRLVITSVVINFPNATQSNASLLSQSLCHG